MDSISTILDLSNKKLKKLNKPSVKDSQVTELILDENELQRLDNIDAFGKLEKLSACHNQLLRMYGVCRLHSLQVLNLSDNGILTIEGLKELTNLKWLCLSKNSIKTIEHLNNNLNLEHLDLSENSITHISDLSFLRNLKELYLHKNKINHLGQCDRFLPVSLTLLTLANNNIADLNEISRLSHLLQLNKISIAGNPCVNMTSNNIGFDYRPFVINWCLNVNVIDDYVVDAIESLRAEWLYSQGRGRHFRIGDQSELTQYLATVCPLTGETLETEEDRKLRLILSKAQHHQQQLREQSSNCSLQQSPITRKKMQQTRSSLKLNRASPDRMSTSCYNSLVDDNDKASLMSQSMDPSILLQNIASQSMSKGFPEKCLKEAFYDTEPINSPLQAVTKMVPVPETLMSPDYKPTPIIERIGKTLIPTSSSVTPDSTNIRLLKQNRDSTTSRQDQLQSQSQLKVEKSPSTPKQHKRKSTNISNKQDFNKKSILHKQSSSEDESEIYDSKLQMIQIRAEEKRMQKNIDNSNKDNIQQAAICIQRMWRGYYARNKNKDVQEIYKTLQNDRSNQFIQKLTQDMETTKAALESERKIQMLQTEAITALWKKMSTLNTEENSGSNVSLTNLTNNPDVVKELVHTCSLLQNQVQQLQNSMQDIFKVMTVFSHSTGLNHYLKENGIATQTEIIAVHTPQDDSAKGFPFQRQHITQHRPSSLPLPINQRRKETTADDPVNSELKEFAGSLVDGVIKTVSEKVEFQDMDAKEVASTSEVNCVVSKNSINQTT
ncbi:centrosomal protein of 97 kDa-like isoform X2 [Sitophilus oryzae]|uniref:Centrosomal protein of 97 kDa n=1 Tax=Sitophilus oryzae TaxID=7048 RepID=A0A6J2XRD9_SITOR|nr:centrosomal protein of 97 kDa-like isoform X2 [Sitophilus oryzae]